MSYSASVLVRSVCLLLFHLHSSMRARQNEQRWRQISMKATFFPLKDKTGDVGTAPVAMPSMSYDHITCADAPLSFAVVVRLQIPTAGVVPLYS